MFKHALMVESNSERLLYDCFNEGSQFLDLFVGKVIAEHLQMAAGHHFRLIQA